MLYLRELYRFWMSVDRGTLGRVPRYLDMIPSSGFHSIIEAESRLSCWAGGGGKASFRPRVNNARATMVLSKSERCVLVR